MKTLIVDRPRSGALRALNYAPVLERLRRIGSTSTQPLKEMAKQFGSAYGTVFTQLDCRSDLGVRLLSQTDTFAAEPLGRMIRKDSMPYPRHHEIRRWMVLVSGAGQMAEGNLFGRSIIADGRLAGCYVGPDTFAIEFDEPGSDLNLWAYAILNSTYGLQSILAAAYGTSIPHLRADFLGDIPIPLPPPDLKLRVAQFVRTAVEQRDKFLDDLTEARRLVENLPEMQTATDMCTIRRRHSVLWDGPFPSLLAWNVASSGGALISLLDKWKSTLGDVVEGKGIYNGPRFARVECHSPHGVEFMSQRDAMFIRPAPRRIVHPGFDDRQLFAREGTILVGGHGTLGEGEIFGRALLVHGRYTRSAFTQDLLRVVPKPTKAHALYAYLTTTVGFRLLRSTAVGTKILSMREDMLRALPVPEWPTEIEEKVSSLVRSAFHARDEGERAEAEAIRIVEQEVLPQWLA